MWSNSRAPDAAYIRAALLRPRFLQLLDVASEVGLARLRKEWSLLEKEDSPEARRCAATTRRILKNMAEGIG